MTTRLPTEIVDDHPISQSSPIWSNGVGDEDGRPDQVPTPETRQSRPILMRSDPRTAGIPPSSRIPRAGVSIRLMNMGVHQAALMICAAADRAALLRR